MHSLWNSKEPRHRRGGKSRKTNDSTKVEKGYWMIFAALRGKFLNNNSEPSLQMMQLRLCATGKQDCKYESAFCRLLRTSPTLTTDGGQPTLPTGKKEDNIPGVQWAQVCSSAQPQPPTTAWTATSHVVKHECFCSLRNKSQQNNRQQFRLLVGLLTLLGVKAVFHIAMVSPVVDRWFHVSQRACVWGSGTTKEENGLVRETFPLLPNCQKYLRPRLTLPLPISPCISVK